MYRERRAPQDPDDAQERTIAHPPGLQPHSMFDIRAFSGSVTDNVIRRRERLSLDYKLFTQAGLDIHNTRRRGVRRMPSRWLATLRRQFLSHYILSPPPWRLWIRQIINERALPDFCIIGPVKSGTSDLAITIMSHPNVLHPLVKEPSSTDPLSWKPYYPTLRAVKRHAQRHGLALCPYVSPSLHYLDIATTLSSLCPDMKIVINLRNPADLVFSFWKWTVLHTGRSLVDRVPFLSTFPAYVDMAVELFPQAPAPIGPALHYGIYVAAVAHWLMAFGERNVRIFDVAEYFADRNSYLQHLEQFLGLPHVSVPLCLPVVNRNPLDQLTPDPGSLRKLKHFFEPYNQSLYELTGTAYSW